MPDLRKVSVNVRSSFYKLQNIQIKMFKTLMICAIFGLAAAGVLQPKGHVEPHVDAHVERHVDNHGGHYEHVDVVERKDEVRADGSDSSYELSNHAHHSDSSDEHGNHHGSYGWISPEGEHVEITYVADEHGYRAEGDAIPKVPEHVVRLLAWNAEHAHEEVAHGHH